MTTICELCLPSSQPLLIFGVRALKTTMLALSDTRLWSRRDAENLFPIELKFPATALWHLLGISNAEPISVLGRQLVDQSSARESRHLQVRAR
jgi:hypothetical protein